MRCCTDGCPEPRHRTVRQWYRPPRDRDGGYGRAERLHLRRTARRELRAGGGEPLGRPLPRRPVSSRVAAVRRTTRTAAVRSRGAGCCAVSVRGALGTRRTAVVRSGPRGALCGGRTQGGPCSRRTGSAPGRRAVAVAVRRRPRPPGARAGTTPGHRAGARGRTPFVADTGPTREQARRPDPGGKPRAPNPWPATARPPGPHLLPRREAPVARLTSAAAVPARPHPARTPPRATTRPGVLDINFPCLQAI